MLSPDMRIRELIAGRYPYRGFLQSFDGTTWSNEQVMGLILLELPWQTFGQDIQQ